MKATFKADERGRNGSCEIFAAAVSGGGKTTISKKLTDRLNEARVLYLDEYETEGPSDFGKWAKDKGDYNEWDISSFMRDVKRVVEEGDSHYLILDYPFSYLNINLYRYAA